MNETLWYYVDRAQQRVGPVTAADVAAAWRAGQATDESLVWHEGLAGWAPLSGFHAELGLGVAAAAPVVDPVPVPAGSPPSAASRPASGVVGTATPAKSGSGCLVVGLVIGGLLLLAAAAFVIAVALPAYRGYQDRVEDIRGDLQADDGEEEFTEDAFDDDDGLGPAADDAGPADAGDVDLVAAVDEARAHQAAVDAFVANTDRCPRDASEIALPAPSTPGVVAIRVGEALSRMCTLEIEFGGAGAAGLAGETVVLSRDAAGDWYCTSGLSGRATLPPDCL